MLELLKAANAHLLELMRLIDAALANLAAGEKDGLLALNEQLKAQLGAFVEAKKALDGELLALAQSRADAQISELLNDAEQEQLKYLRINLNNLAKKNSAFASVVMSLKDFYDDLLGSMLGTDDDYSAYFRK